MSNAVQSASQTVAKLRLSETEATSTIRSTERNRCGQSVLRNDRPVMFRPALAACAAASLLLLSLSDAHSSELSTAACAAHSKFMACPNNSIIGAGADVAGCACLLGCDCNTVGNASRYTGTYTCECNATQGEVAAFVWMEVSVVDPSLVVNYSVVSPWANPPLDVSGSIRNLSMQMVPGNLSKSLGNDPFRVLYPVTFRPLTSKHELSFGFAFGPLSSLHTHDASRLSPDLRQSGTPAASVAGGLASCTTTGIKVLPRPQAPPINSSAQVSWNTFPTITASYLAVHVLLEV